MKTTKPTPEDVQNAWDGFEAVHGWIPVKTVIDLMRSGVTAEDFEEGVRRREIMIRVNQNHYSGGYPALDEEEVLRICQLAKWDEDVAGELGDIATTRNLEKQKGSRR